MKHPKQLKGFNYSYRSKQKMVRRDQLKKQKSPADFFFLFCSPLTDWFPSEKKKNQVTFFSFFSKVFDGAVCFSSSLASSSFLDSGSRLFSPRNITNTTTVTEAHLLSDSFLKAIFMAAFGFVLPSKRFITFEEKTLPQENHNA